MNRQILKTTKKFVPITLYSNPTKEFLPIWLDPTITHPNANEAVNFSQIEVPIKEQHEDDLNNSYIESKPNLAELKMKNEDFSNLVPQTCSTTTEHSEIYDDKDPPHSSNTMVYGPAL